MRDSIIMTKYQGFGNDYLVLDANKNQLQLQGKKIALLCQRGFGLGADGVLYGPVEINGNAHFQLRWKRGCHQRKRCVHFCKIPHGQ